MEIRLSFNRFPKRSCAVIQHITVCFVYVLEYGGNVFFPVRFQKGVVAEYAHGQSISHPAVIADSQFFGDGFRFFVRTGFRQDAKRVGKLAVFLPVRICSEQPGFGRIEFFFQAFVEFYADILIINRLVVFPCHREKFCRIIQGYR